MEHAGSQSTRASAFILGASILIALGAIASRVEYVPIWDGGSYAECIVDAASNNFSPYYLRCFEHPSHAYVIITGLAYKLAPGSHLPILVVDALLFAAACLGFQRLSRLALPNPTLSIERSLLTAAFVVQPSFLAMVVQPNLDLPVLAGFVWCLVTLIERRLVRTVLIGTAISFSKETGALLYGVAVTCYAAWQFAREHGPFTARVRAVLRLAPLAIPVIVFAAYLLAFAVLRPGSSPFWSDSGAGVGILRPFLVPRFDNHVASYALMIFVLNFAWIPSLLVLAQVIVAVRSRVSAVSREAPQANRDVIAFCAAMCVLVIYCVTRFPTFTNARYVAVAVAMMILMLGIALVRTGLPPRWRVAVTGAYVALLVPSVFRTIDPASRLAFGTFSIGSHRMLRLTSLTNECCGPNGRDQLAYSLEFTVVDNLLNQALVALKETGGLTIVVPGFDDWYTIGRIDAATGRRRLGREGVRKPLVIDEETIVTRRMSPPANAWYFALPSHDATEVSKLGGLYTIGAARKFEHKGYEMAIHPLTKSGSSAAR